jgi:hypothetical protein
VFLEAMGFTSSGKNYGRDGIKSFVAKYPNIYTHFSLEKEEELKPDNDYENQLAAMDWSRVVFLFIAMMVIWPKAVTGHIKYEGILLICQMRFAMSKILASMKMNGSITNSSRSTNARPCFSIKTQRFSISTAKNSICSNVDNKSSIFPIPKSNLHGKLHSQQSIYYLMCVVLVWFFFFGFY